MWLRKKEIINHTITINPTKLTEHDAKILRAFLLADEKKAKNKQRKVFDADSSKYGLKYTFEMGNVHYTIKFTHRLVRRARKNPYKKYPNKKYPSKYVYTIFNPYEQANIIGVGSFGGVYKVDGKLKYTRHSISYHHIPLDNPEKRKVIKAQALPFTDDPEKYQDRISSHKLENELTRKVEYLNSKKITFYGNKEKIASYIVMRELGDTDMAEIIRRRGELTIEELFHLTINLSAALQTLHRLGIIHRDIKPENIRVNSKTFEVYIIDFGLGRKEECPDHLGPGSAPYAAPEMFFKPEIANEAADTFGLGYLLQELWDVPVRMKQRGQFEAKEFVALRREEYQQYGNLREPTAPVQFSDDIDMALGEARKQNLGNILAQMTHPNPSTRLSNENALIAFKAIAPPLKPQKITLLPRWLKHMRKIVNLISKHLKDYDTTKRGYVENAIELVNCAFRQYNNENETLILDMFKILMVCCFQNKKGHGFFPNLKTKTGLDIEKKLRKVDYRNPQCPTTMLREKLFGKNYGGNNAVLPNYNDMVNAIYKDQIDKYKDDTNHATQNTLSEFIINKNKKVTFALTPTGKVDVLKTASLLIGGVNNTSVRLTVKLLGNTKLVNHYYETSQPTRKARNT